MPSLVPLLLLLSLLLQLLLPLCSSGVGSCCSGFCLCASAPLVELWICSGNSIWQPQCTPPSLLTNSSSKSCCVLPWCICCFLRVALI